MHCLILKYTIMRKVLIALMLVIPFVCYSQGHGETKKLTKFEEFSSKTGSITKFVDTKMPNIPESFIGSLKVGVRTIIGSQKNIYFYRIEEEETSSSTSHIAMIEYSDLVEINKALNRLSSDVNSDIQSNPDYLENKFVTEDGFQVGYYISKGKASWYMTLERYSSSTVFVNNAEVLTSALKDAQSKIEELKSKYGK